MENYFIIGTNKVEEFVLLMGELEIPPICMQTGIPENVLMNVHKEAQKRDISIFAVQESLVQEIQQRVDMGIVSELRETDGEVTGTINEREFVFLTIDNREESMSGVLIPFERNVKEKQGEITDKEIEDLKKILEADIDVETFLKLV